MISLIENTNFLKSNLCVIMLNNKHIAHIILPKPQWFVLPDVNLIMISETYTQWGSFVEDCSNLDLNNHKTKTSTHTQDKKKRRLWVISQERTP